MCSTHARPPEEPRTETASSEPTSTGLRPFFCYYGGKWRAAPRYPPPEHETIVEPFAGAAGYATRYADRKVVLIERDPLIAALWRYLIRVSRDEIASLPFHVPDTVDSLPVCEEARWLIAFWCNKGSATPKNAPSTWMRSKIRARSHWGPEVCAIIASQVERIRHWQVIEGSYERAPNIAATWFIDPPYQKAGKHYRYGAEQIDYENLSAWVASREGLVIACENDGAAWLSFKPFATIKASPAKHGGKASKETVFIRRSGEVAA